MLVRKRKKVPLQPSWCSAEGRRGRWGWRQRWWWWRTPWRRGCSRWGQRVTWRERGRPSWRKMMKRPCQANTCGGLLRSQDKQTLRSVSGVCTLLLIKSKLLMKTQNNYNCCQILNFYSHNWKKKIFAIPIVFYSYELSTGFQRAKISMQWRLCVACVL